MCVFFPSQNTAFARQSGKKSRLLSPDEMTEEEYRVSHPLELNQSDYSGVSTTPLTPPKISLTSLRWLSDPLPIQVLSQPPPTIIQSSGVNSMSQQPLSRPSPTLQTTPNYSLSSQPPSNSSPTIKTPQLLSTPDVILPTLPNNLFASNVPSHLPPTINPPIGVNSMQQQTLLTRPSTNSSSWQLSNSNDRTSTQGLSLSPTIHRPLRPLDKARIFCFNCKLTTAGSCSVGNAGINGRKTPSKIPI